MDAALCTWDFFLAHAGPDQEQAERLCDLLGGARVFLASRCLALGARWDEELPRAQAASFITVVLISARTEQAWYEKDEIAHAISLARQDGRRVVPVYLDGLPREAAPYGLRRLHGRTLRADRDWHDLARDLLALLGARPPAPPPAAPAAPRAGVAMLVVAAAADAQAREALHRHVAPLEQAALLWLDDPRRGPATGLDPAALRARLAAAPVIVLLVSSDLLYDHPDLVAEALRRHQAGARVVPVLLRDLSLSDSPLGRLRALPREHGPIRRWPDADAAWTHVAEELRAVALAIRPRPGDKPGL